MAQSGSYNNTYTGTQIITNALRYVGILGEGESASSTQLSESLELLNMIVKLRAADGMPTWALKRGYILPFTGASSINTDSHVVTSYTHTNLDGAVASSGTSLTVDSISGISDGDVIGIELSDSTMYYDVVSGSPSGTTVTLTTGLSGAASDGADVYAYTTTNRVQKPITVTQVNMLDISSSSSWEIDLVSREDYFRLGNRTSTGVPNQVYYSIAPSTDTALDTNGVFYVYPRFSNGNYVIEFTYQRPFQDMDTVGSDNLDFPQAFHLAIMLELAALLGPQKGVDIQERKALREEAMMYLQQALYTVHDGGSLKLQKEDR